VNRAFLSRRPDESRRRRIERGTAGAAVLAVAVAGVLAVAAPPDAEQGQWQRLMYLHVPAAWTAFLAFGVVAVASAVQLCRADLRADRYAAAAAEAGVVTTGVTLVVGSVWARATWGTWWAWDPRLVSTAGLFLSYLACLGVRGCTDQPRRAARWAAIIGLLGFAEVPVVYMSVRWWRTLHQQPTFLAAGGGSAPIAGGMLLALVASLVAFLLALCWWLLYRVRRLEAAALSDALATPISLAGGPRAARR
jgi:heme exporter protein C